MNSIIEFRDVSFSYSNQKIVESINLKLYPNDFMAILGPNGGGKTTLLKLILGVLKPDSGSIRIFGEKPEKARNRIGYVPQYGEFDKHFPISVLQTVLMAELTHKSWFPFYQKQMINKAENVLNKMQIGSLATKKMDELSGGQKQRVLIARALMSNPEILLLDEPMASLDPEVEKDIYVLLKELNQTKTILFVSHDINVISLYVNRVTCLNVCSCTHTIEELNEQSLIEVYNGSLQTIRHTCKL